MAHPGNGDTRYEVYCSGVVAKAVRAAHRQATKEGRGQAMVKAFRQAVRELQQNPTHFGEPLYRLPALRMQVYTAVVRPSLSTLPSVRTGRWCSSRASDCYRSSYQC